MNELLSKAKLGTWSTFAMAVALLVASGIMLLFEATASMSLLLISFAFLSIFNIGNVQIRLIERLNQERQEQT